LILLKRKSKLRCIYVIFKIIAIAGIIIWMGGPKEFMELIQFFQVTLQSAIVEMQREAPVEMPSIISLPINK
jgi:hypothetical protein